MCGFADAAFIVHMDVSRVALEISHKSMTTGLHEHNQPLTNTLCDFDRLTRYSLLYSHT